ncbi:MAG: inorganic phosphate transporter [Prevotella sp.]|nr:inorganic phosphate transporter [Prevotella sp.]MDD4533238.1 inorganic phosphate transporter [Prevotella sp.]
MAILISIIVLGLIFDFINGFHDAANSISTIVTTRVLTPFQAVIWAAFFNFVAFFISKYIIGEFGIANTVSKTVYEEYITLPIILAGVIGAIIWNLLTWWRGIPSSSSHTLIGGFAGSAIMANGFNAIHGSIILKIASFIFLAPFIGMVIAFFISLLVTYGFRNVNHHKANDWFKHLQLVSSALFSVGHGMNDSQKVMGIIAAAMIAAHPLHIGLGIQSVADIPDWVAFSCFAAISIGTMSGGWRIVKTMGTKITKVTPLEGVVAETAGAITLYLTEILKIPVSTTHTIAGSIMGVGATKRLSAVRWGIMKDLMIAWILTIPVSALLGAGIYKIVMLFL